MTDFEIQNYIKANIPGISYQDMRKIRDRLVYDCVDLDEAIAEYKNKI